MTIQGTFAKLRLLFALAFGLLFVATAVVGPEVSAQDTGAACEGISLAGGDCDEAGAEGELGDIVSAIVNILSIIVGAISVIMIIIGGLKYITSGGDSAGTASAKNTIIYAIVGLLVVIFAQVIVSFVIDRAGNPDGDTTTTEEGGGGAPTGDGG